MEKKKLYKDFLIKRLKKTLGTQSSAHISDYLIAKQALKFRVTLLHFIRDTLFIFLGVICASFGLTGFLLSNGFIDGGVTGISLLVNATTEIPLYYLIIIINAPFIILGYYQISRSFAIRSVFAILGLALALATIEYPIITSDKLLVAIFGGFFLGAGIGLAVRGGSVLDGTEVLAVYLNRKIGLTIGDLILVFNIFIFLTAAYLLSIETALYSILTYLAASKTVDFIIEGVEEYIGVTIISTHSDEIREMLTVDMRKGVTIFKGKRGFGKRGENLNEIDIIYTVSTRLEIAKLQTEVQKIDMNAFIVMDSVKDLKGGMIKRRPLNEHE